MRECNEEDKEVDSFNMVGTIENGKIDIEKGVKMNGLKEFYKPSAYVHKLECNDGIILYSAMEGIKSIKKFSLRNKERINQFFLMDTIKYSDDKLLNKLIENNYLIPTDCDENKSLKNLYVDSVNNSILHLVILPTEQCNFRCKYCYESFSRGKMSSNTIEAIIKYVKINIHKYTGVHVSWFGGEPSLEIDIICKASNALLEICKRTKRKYWADITSNGYLIDKTNFEKLYKARIFDYQITIDGIETTHDNQRVLTNGKGSFQKIINNLLDIKKDNYNKHWNITIRTNFSKPIYDVVDLYMEYYYDLFNDDKRFSFLFRPAGNWGGNRVRAYQDKLLENDGLTLVFEQMLNSNKILNMSRHLAFLEPGGSMCMAAHKNTLLIDSSGIIRKCSCHLDDNRNIIGKIEEDKKFNIDLRERDKWIFFDDSESRCKNCKFIPACLNNACPADYILGRASVEKCHVYEKRSLDYILQLLDKRKEIEEINI